MFTLLHRARPVLIDFDAPFAIAPWADRVVHLETEYAGAWELPVIGAVPAPTAVLVRPDGHLAWVGEGDHTGLAEALTKWFGPARA